VRKITVLVGIVALFLSTFVSAEEISVKVNGDLRYRHEWAKKEGKKERTRQRLRARANIEGKINNEARVVIGFSSGADDPVSNNTTLDDAFASKEVVLDLAFFEYKFNKPTGLNLLGGKFYNPFFLPGKSELIWDSDLRHEGLVAHFDYGPKQIALRITGGAFWIEERKEDLDSYLVTGQAVVKYAVPDSKSQMALGGGYYHYENVKGFEAFHDTTGAGNTVDTAGLYVWDYRIVEVFGEAKFVLGRVPVTFLGNYVNNTGADSLNTGWLIGFRAGKASKPGSWDLRYNYREINADAVLGIFTDSDFIGGGTDGKGHEFGVGIAVAPKTVLAATYFINKIGAKNGKDFNRLMIDAKFKF
jgi:hypothetical protein